ncbi:hypothetical protein SFRURICE_001498 [Spodoptera frugiperda]|nr:hypothetical protein SFRURICE_001498 [Spodoptera frugiperda]
MLCSCARKMRSLMESVSTSAYLCTRLRGQACALPPPRQTPSVERRALPHRVITAPSTVPM